MSWLQTAGVALLPMVAQFLCLLELADRDACKNNPGCMAGSLSGYVAILLLPACAFLFVLLALIARWSRRVDPMNALVINLAVALLPFALLFVMV